MNSIRYIILTSFLSLLFSVNTIAANTGYEIKIKIAGLSDTTIYLSNFFGKNQYYKDTANVDANGNMVFSGDEPLEQGLYTLVIDHSKIIDFFVIEQKFSIETDTSDYLGKLKIKGSPENELFYSYVNFINSKHKAVATLNKQKKEADEAGKKEIDNQILALNEEVFAFQKDFVVKHEGTFVAKFIHAMLEIDVPEAPKLANGKTDSTFAFRYYKAHYFDNIDFSDARYLRTPIYHNMMTKYIQNLTIQYPDSMYKSIDYLVGKSEENYELFQYTVSWITNTYEKSKIMGMDAIFVHMAEKYYLTGKVGWIDSVQTEKIRDRYVKLKPLLLGKKAPNIILADSAQKTWYNLYDIKAAYTIVYIWSPTCGHCKKITPKMHELYLKYKDQGLKVFAVSTEYENKEWKRYIKKNKLTWINVSDSPEYPNNIKDHPNNYRERYDVYSTPQIYLLDENKTIIAKKLENEQLDDMLQKLFKDKEQLSNNK